MGQQQQSRPTHEQSQEKHTRERHPIPCEKQKSKKKIAKLRVPPTPKDTPPPQSVTDPLAR